MHIASVEFCFVWVLAWY